MSVLGRFLLTFGSWKRSCCIGLCLQLVALVGLMTRETRYKGRKGRDRWSYSKGFSLSVLLILYQAKATKKTYNFRYETDSSRVYHNVFQAELKTVTAPWRTLTRIRTLFTKEPISYRRCLAHLARAFHDYTFPTGKMFSVV